MNFIHRFEVAAGLDEVARFHRQSASMARITPPPIIVRVHDAPVELSDGDRMMFTLWVGPFPIRWTAQIESVSKVGFVDRQLAGPFAKWEHRHIFVPLQDSRTAIIDNVSAKPHGSWFLKVVGLAMWIGMPALFAYRGWATKRLLEAR